MTLLNPASYKVVSGSCLSKRCKARGLLLCLILVAAPFLFPLNALAQPTTKKVLILTGTDPNHPGFSTITQALRAVLRNTSTTRIEFIYELQAGFAARVSSEDDQHLITYLKEKYQNQQIDLIYSMAAPRLKLLLQTEPTLFANIPKVFYEFEFEREATLKNFGTHATGVWAKIELSKTLDLALTLHPDTQRLIVVAGNSETEKAVLEQARKDLQPYESKLAVTYVTNVTVEELKSQLASLPKQTVVMYLIFYADRAGKVYPGPEALSIISPTSSAPIYGNTDSYLGYGIVGGSLLDFPTLGGRLAEAGQRILAGEKAENIPSQTVPTVTMFDWRELKRWGISEQRLPPGSIVRFRESTVWELYKWYIIALVGAIIIEAMLIAALLFLQVRRRQAERENERLAGDAEAQHKKLGEVVSNVPGLVWESRVQPNKTNKTTFISDYVEQMLGYTAAEWMAQPPGFGASLIPDKEERERALNDSKRVLQTGSNGFSQFRWRAKNGRILWVETYLNPIFDENHKVVGLRGVTLDISERKLAEQTVQKTEEKSRAIVEAIPDLIFLQTRDGVYLDLHYSDADKLIVPPQDYLGRNMRDILPPELAEKFTQYFQRAIDTGATQIVEYELTSRDEHRWFESRLVCCGENILSVVRDITERRESELALGESEARLRLAQQAARVGTWEWNLVTGESIWSDMIWELLGLKPADSHVHVDKFVQFIHPEDRDRTLEKVNAAIKNGGEYYDEFRIIRPDGNVVWLSSKGRVLRAPNGDAERMIGVNIDINTRKMAEETAWQTKQKDTAILNAIPDLMFLQTRDGVYLDYHANDPKDLFISPEKFLGKNMSEVLPAELAMKVAHSFERTKESNEPQILEYQLPINGAYRWFECRLVGSGENVLSVVRDITERREALNELRASEERFGKAFRANPQPMSLTILSTGHYLDVNDSFVAASGYSRDELLGHTSVELGIWETPGHRAEFVRQVEEQGSVVNVETVLCGKNGRRRTFLSSAEQVDLGGERCLLMASSDITERKLAEEALHESEEKYRTLFESIDEGFCVFDLIYDEGGRAVDFVFRVANPAFERQTGWHNVVGLGVREFAPALEESWFEKYAQVAATSMPVRFMDWAAALNSWYEVYAFPVGEAGSPTVAAIFSDVSERVRAEQTLHESEARFRNMADTAPVLIWVSDTDNLCTYVNQQWIEFTGRSAEQELGAGWKEGIHPDDGARCLETYSAAFGLRESFQLEYRLRRADGEFRWVFDSGTPRFSVAGEFLGYIGSCVDITDRKESEAALYTAHKQLMAAHEEVNRLKNQLQQENIYLKEEINLSQDFGDIIGHGDALKYVLFKIEQVAPTETTVLISGETGTGKELVARAIHKASNRSDRPLVRVNCAALAASLIESELFGHEKGSFTGATARKIGRFELADEATIFLDEIGELPLELQVKLLRVIQEGEFERLGSSRTLKVDVRIIAATNRNLEYEVKRGTFREDLWYRLNVFPITVPPLRQRPEDIAPLVEHFAALFAKKFGKVITSVSPSSLKSLRDYSWPGNVRELANVIERAAITSKGSVLRIGDDFGKLAQEQLEQSSQTLEELERDYIIRILADSAWRIEGPHGAARILGMNPSTLRTRMAKLGIQKPGQSFTKGTI